MKKKMMICNSTKIKYYFLSVCFLSIECSQHNSGYAYFASADKPNILFIGKLATAKEIPPKPRPSSIPLKPKQQQNDLADIPWSQVQKLPHHIQEQYLQKFLLEKQAAAFKDRLEYDDSSTRHIVQSQPKNKYDFIPTPLYIRDAVDGFAMFVEAASKLPPKASAHK